MKKVLEEFARIYRFHEDYLMGKTDFMRLRYKKGEKLEMEISSGIMVTILEGEVHIMCNHLWLRDSIKKGEFFLLLEHSFISIDILEDTEVFIMRYPKGEKRLCSTNCQGCRRG